MALWLHLLKHVTFMLHLAGSIAGLVGGTVVSADVRLGNPPAALLCLCTAMGWPHTKEQT